MRRIFGVVALLLGVSLAFPAARQAKPPNDAEITDVIDRAFVSVYNLDHAEALALARRSVALGPGEARTHRALASIVWLQVLFLRGAIMTDHYLSGRVNQTVSMPKPPAELESEFKREVMKAIELAEIRLGRNANEVPARFDQGSAYGLLASYQASVEGSVMTGFRTAKRAFDALEDVLNRDPRRIEAGLVVGTYRYVVATLSPPARMLAYVAGFGGGKERGIAMIETAQQAPDSHVDARVALLIIYSREGRHVDALRIARELEAEFPKNRLFTLEAGSAALRAGRAAEAEVTFLKGFAFFEKDTRMKFPGERAFWLFKRGSARLALNHLPLARADFESALQNQPLDWVRGRIQLQLGKVADLTGRRNDALAAYRVAQSICASRNDPACAEEAARFLKKPFKF